MGRPPSHPFQYDDDNRHENHCQKLTIHQSLQVVAASGCTHEHQSSSSTPLSSSLASSKPKKLLGIKIPTLLSPKTIELGGGRSKRKSKKNDGPRMCYECERIFPTGKAYGGHKRHRHPNNNNIRPLSPSPTPSSSPRGRCSFIKVGDMEMITSQKEGKSVTSPKCYSNINRWEADCDDQLQQIQHSPKIILQDLINTSTLLSWGNKAKRGSIHPDPNLEDVAQSLLALSRGEPLGQMPHKYDEEKEEEEKDKELNHIISDYKMMKKKRKKHKFVSLSEKQQQQGIHDHNNMQKQIQVATPIQQHEDHALGTPNSNFLSIEIIDVLQTNKKKKEKQNYKKLSSISGGSTTDPNEVKSADGLVSEPNLIKFHSSSICPTTITSGGEDKTDTSESVVASNNIIIPKVSVATTVTSPSTGSIKTTMNPELELALESSSSGYLLPPQTTLKSNKLDIDLNQLPA